MSSTTRRSIPGSEGKALAQHAAHGAVVEGAPSPSMGHVFRCPQCSRVFLVVAAEGATAAARCACGAELVGDVLPAGAYEIQMRAHSSKRRVASGGRGRARGEEADQGYGSSHGYGPGHGGPTSPGDAPACGTQGTPACDPPDHDIDEEPRET